MRRGLTDGKWKYIRNFNPHLPQVPYSFYQFGQPGWTAFKKAFDEGKLAPEFAALWHPGNLLDQLPKDWAKGKNMKGGDYDYIERFSIRIEK